MSRSARKTKLLRRERRHETGTEQQGTTLQERPDDPHRPRCRMCRRRMVEMRWLLNLGLCEVCWSVRAQGWDWRGHNTDTNRHPNLC
jgi:hypothetical protein